MTYNEIKCTILTFTQQISYVYDKIRDKLKMLVHPILVIHYITYQSLTMHTCLTIEA